MSKLTGTETDLKIRSAGSSRVLTKFGDTFKSTLTGQVAASKKSDKNLKYGESDDTPGKEDAAAREAHSECDTVFESSQVAEVIDAMLSHVWSAGRWAKTLGLCYYLNGTTAVHACCLASVAGTVYAVIVWGNGDYTALGGDVRLVISIQVIPVLIYILVIVNGPQIVPCVTQQWWLDKICIHQSRPTLKIHGVTSLPDVVSFSSRMCVLWNDTYFSRLWCNDELATFTASHGGAHGIDFQPLWFAPWIFASMIFDVISNVLIFYTVVVIPMIGAWTQGQGYSPPVCVLLTFGIGVMVCMGTAYLPAVLGHYHALTQKLENHRLMIEQLDNYSLAKAECTVESDRQWVEEHVIKLFSKSNPEDPIGAFDEYMRNGVKGEMEKTLGGPTDVKFAHAVLCFMPMLLGTMQNTLSCDNRPCELTAKAEGAPSILAWMIVNTIIYFGSIFHTVIPMFPMMLRGVYMVNKCLKPGGLRIAAGFLVTTVIMFFSFFATGIWCALFKCSHDFGGAFWGGFLGWFGLYCYIHYIYFFAKSQPKTHPEKPEYAPLAQT